MTSTSIPLCLSCIQPLSTSVIEVRSGIQRENNFYHERTGLNSRNASFFEGTFFGWFERETARTTEAILGVIIRKQYVYCLAGSE